MSTPSFASIVNRCDNFRLESTTESFAEFRLSYDSKHIIGLIPNDVLDALRVANRTALSTFQPTVWDIGQKSPAGTIASYDLSIFLIYRYAVG